jgi:hypothetical protein
VFVPLRLSDYIFLVIGTIALLVGIFFFAFPEITYKTIEHVSLGPISLEKPVTRMLVVPRYMSTVVAAAGAFLIFFLIPGAKKRGG